MEGPSDSFKEAKEYLGDPENKSKLVESVVCDHLIRLAYSLQPSDTFDPEDFLFLWYDTKEVDFLLKYEGRLWPIEVAYQENPEKDIEWMKKRFGPPLIILRDTFRVNSEVAIISASLFLFLI